MFSNIQRIDFEFHSKCNRKCSWCPNSFLDRTSTDIFLNYETFKKVLYELYENNFGTKSYRTGIRPGATISFLGYQEPLLQPEKLKEYVSLTKEIFYDRNVAIITNTNGDFFSEENIEGLKLSELQIMDYDCKGAQYWKSTLEKNKCAIINFSKKSITAIHKNINLITVCLDWPKNHFLEDRGGSLLPEQLDPNLKWLNNREKRTFPCPEPAYCINIYYDGSVTPCCHIRPDNKNHSQFILGNVNTESLMNIFFGKKASDFRKVMTSLDSSKYWSTCTYCQKFRKLDIDFSVGQEFPPRFSSKKNEYVENLPPTETSFMYLNSRKKWTKEQIQTWEQSKKYYQREIWRDKKLYPNSYYNSINFWFNAETAKSIYEMYCKNWKILTNYYDYCYLNPYSDNMEDISGKEISFTQFSFSKNSMINDYLNYKGFYQPFLAYKNKKANVTTIMAGRHRLAAFNQIADKNIYAPYETICFYFDAYDPNFEDYLYIPKDLYNNVLKTLNLQTVNYNEDFIKVLVNNPIDINIIMKIYEKEIDFLIEYYQTDLIKNNILPDQSILNKGIQ